MKKFIPLVVVGLVVLCGMEAVALPFNMVGTNVQKWSQTPYTPLNKADILDQSQPDWDDGIIVGCININGSSEYYLAAQSFIPTLNILTRVELMICRIPEATYNYTVAIREDLNGSDLTSVSLPASYITIMELSWEEFDFPDIMVIPGKTYYIVSSPENVINNVYLWAVKGADVYPNGILFYRWNGAAWEGYSDGDMTFKTYGVNNTQPDKPTIDGPHYGKTKTVYTFSIGEITDPNGDSLYCLWNWGDGNSSGWLGPYDSGQIVSNSHAWNEPGTYTIKVKLKDSYGAESDSEPFIIEIVELKTAFFLGTFENLSGTDDLWILQSRFFIVFPSDSIFYKGETIVISKDNLGYVGTSFTLGVGGVAIF